MGFIQASDEDAHGEDEDEEKRDDAVQLANVFIQLSPGKRAKSVSLEESSH